MHWSKIQVNLIEQLSVGFDMLFALSPPL